MSVITSLLTWNMNYSASKRALPPETEEVDDDDAPTAASGGPSKTHPLGETRDERLTATLEGVLKTHAPTIVALQEASPDAAKAVASLGYVVVNDDEFVTAISVKDGAWVEDAAARILEKRWGLRTTFVHSSAMRVRIYNVHLLSRLHAQDGAIRLRAADLRANVQQVRGSSTGESEVLIGDFNLVPHDQMILHPMHVGLGANPCTRWVSRRGDVKVRGFVNLTSVVADPTGYPRASYFASVVPDGPWFQYDQILVSPDLAAGKSARSELIPEVNGVTLCKRGKYLQASKEIASDHFPVLAHLTVKPPLATSSRRRAPKPGP